MRTHYSEINYSALEAAVRRIQQDVDFLMRYLPNVPDDAYVKVETTKILKQHNLEPKDMFDIAEGTREGNREAVLKTFEDYGEIAGDAMATAATLIDGLIVIGGGITAARKYIMPALLKEMRGQLQRMNGETISRLQFKVYDLDDFNEFVEFAKGGSRELKIYGTDKSVVYDPMKRIGITISKLGASRAISLGAYAFALQQIDRQE